MYLIHEQLARARMRELRLTGEQAALRARLSATRRRRRRVAVAERRRVLLAVAR